MARDLRVHNAQRLQTGQLAASVPISTPGASRPLHALNVSKKGVMTRPGVAVAQPVQGRLTNSFNSSTNNNARIGNGFTIQYPVARVIPAMRARMAGNTGHPVVQRARNPLQRSK